MRAFNLDIFRDDGEEYLRSGPFGVETDRQVLQRIRNVPGKKIRRIIEAVPPFAADDWRSAWSHFMAVSAGTHPWPDANQRTAMAAFSQVTYEGMGFLVDMEPALAERMCSEAKRIRDGERRSGKDRFFTVAELADPEHPYRVHFGRYEGGLRAVHVW